MDTSLRRRHWSGTGRGCYVLRLSEGTLVVSSDHQPGGITVRVVVETKDAAKRYRRVNRAIAVIWKMLMVVEKRFRRLNAPDLTGCGRMGLRTA